MEAIQGSLSELSTFFKDKMSEFESQLKKSPGTSVEVAAEYSVFKKFVLDSLNCLQRQVEVMSQNIDALEMRSRRKILLLHGVAEQTTEDTTKVVVDVVRERLESDITEVAVKRCHRMGRQSGGSKPRPILVKLHDVTVRDKIWYAKTKLKGSGITVSEFLTKSRHSTFMAARERFGVSKCWTKQGNIHILCSNGVRHQITSMRELNKIADLEPEIHPTGKQDTEKLAPAAEPKKRRGAAINKK